MKVLLLCFFSFLVYRGIAQLPNNQFLIHLKNTGLTPEDSASLSFNTADANKTIWAQWQVDHFVFKGTTDYKQIGRILIKQARKGRISRILLENAEITAIAKGPDSPDFDFTGTPNQSDYTSWLNTQRSLREEEFKVGNKMWDANDTDKANLFEQLNDIKKKKEIIKRDFISNHKNSFVSLLILKELLSYERPDLDFIKKAFDQLDNKLKQEEEYKKTYALWQGMFMNESSTTAPYFSLIDISGKPVSISDFKGKYIFLDFWATWCGPCLKQVSLLKKLQPKLSDSIVIVAISIDTDKEKWSEFLKKQNYPWVQLLDTHQKVQEKYGIAFIPQNFLIDPQGKIIAKNLEENELAKELLSLH